ncbi:MAG: glycosyltransferase [Proteobacteria bacterium]|nr:glycosyltransferase [Pseudomonadota bacterium]
MIQNARYLFHLITGLDRGGAEVMLLKLLRGADSARYRHVVYVLSPALALLHDFRNAGVEVRTLDVRGLGGLLKALWIVRCAAVRERPALLMSWLHHADLFAVLLKACLPSLPIVWNLRCSVLNLGELPRLNLILVRLLALLSFIPSAVVTNSQAGRSAHAAVGYHPRRWVLLPNGFDLEVFYPDRFGGELLRNELGLGEDDFLIGTVGRYHPMKGYGIFSAAAAQVSREYPHTRFVMVGKGLDQANLALVATLEDAANATIFLGERSDVPQLMNAFDVMLLTSTSEGFPNVIGEAMACAVPCVATDVGDCREVIGETGIVAEAGSPAAVAAALGRMIGLSREARADLGVQARQRVEKHFGMQAIVRRYEELFDEIAR